MTDEIRGALIAAVVSILIFWGSHRLATQAAARERRRKAIEDWYRALSAWVDEYALPESEPDYRYNSLTSRVVLELSLTRKDRYLAWWMHEMAVSLIMRRQAASQSEKSAKNCSAELHEILLDTGEALTAWHHGKLKGSDFHIPYALRNHARMQKRTVIQFAEEYKLTEFIKPIRRTWSRRWRIWVRMTDPKEGTKIMEALGRFTGLDAAFFGLTVTVARLPLIQLRLLTLRLRHAFLTFKLRLTKIRHERRRVLLEQKIADLRSATSQQSGSTDTESSPPEDPPVSKGIPEPWSSGG